MLNFLQYKKPRLVKAAQGWYVSYTYKIPTTVRHYYENKTWYRFRITKDMNRLKGKEKEDFGNLLLKELTNALKSGYNPFTPELEYIKGLENKLPDVITVETAFKMFLDAWEKRGLENSTSAKYTRAMNRLNTWAHKNRLLYGDIKNITVDHIEKFLSDAKTEYGYSNREYNNVFTHIRTCFNYLLKKEIISKSPCAGITKLKSNANKNRFFNSESIKKITHALIVTDPYAYLASQTIYYLCVRSEKELKYLRAGNIQWEQDKILLEASGTKGKDARYVPMDANIKALFLERGIDKCDPTFYVFGIKGKPANKPFGKGFFSKRFKAAREMAGLSPDYTMYSMKHTRIIHLKQDGLDDATIMSLTGHKDFTAYAKYLRDLGLDANPEKINTVSRKV